MNLRGVQSPVGFCAAFPVVVFGGASLPARAPCVAARFLRAGSGSSRATPSNIEEGGPCQVALKVVAAVVGVVVAELLAPGVGCQPGSWWRLVS